MVEDRLALDDGSLVDLLDRLLDTGVALDGNVLITLAGVDLIRLDLRLLLASVETLRDPRQAYDGPHHRQDGLRGPKGRPFHVDSPHRWYPPDSPDPDWWGASNDPATRPPDALVGGTGNPAGPSWAAPGPSAPAPDAGRLATLDPTGDPAPGVAGLVVAVIDLLRRLLERQALRRMDGGELSDDQVERLGRTLRALERQVDELAESLGLRRAPP
ncbi:MAG TPA: gas vesicle protein K [Mycobacteriales bacterium]|nr:gas vesicle protein K [Mycobacteriales bacterium]